MSVNFGTTNSTRYYSVPDDASLTLPNGEWTWLAVAKHTASVAQPKYLLSTGNYQVANSHNIFITASTGDKLQSVYNTASVTETPSAVSTSTYNLIYVTRRSNGSIYHGTVTVGGSSANEATGIVATGTTSNGTGLVFGARIDLNTDRFWRGYMSWLAFMPGRAISAAEAVALADGTDILMDVYSADVQNLWDLSTSADATITDIVGGLVATKNGTSYGTDDTDPLPYASSSGAAELEASAVSIATATGELDGVAAALSGSATVTATASGQLAAVRGVLITLHDNTGTILGNITDITARWYDSPTASGAPQLHTNTASITSGVLELDIDSVTSLDVDDVGYLQLYKAGSTPDDDLHFGGRVSVVDIA